MESHANTRSTQPLSSLALDANTLTQQILPMEPRSERLQAARCRWPIEWSQSRRTMPVSSAQMTVAALQCEGLDHILELPGTTVMHPIGALDEAVDIRFVSVRHEQAAATMMPGSFARGSRRLTACRCVRRIDTYAVACGAGSPGGWRRLMKRTEFLSYSSGP
jgi:hypothetical protein